MKGSILDSRKEEILSLFIQGLTDCKIAEQLGLKESTLYAWRKKNGYIRESLCKNRELPLTQDNLEVLIGTLLGDGTLEKAYANARYSNSHGPQQKEYCEYITQQLFNLGAKTIYSKRKQADIRTGITYEKYECKTPCNPALNQLYKAFYPKGKKVIPTKLFRYFTAKSLAFLYMDDGNKMQHGYAIATCCFTVQEILKFRQFLFKKFNLETSMFKDHRIYIKAISAKHFENLISPYIHPSMKYKLQSS